jgi:hypothetical protein
VTDALQARKRDPRVKVPWSGFDLINSFNAWKKSEDAGRVFIAAPDGTIVTQAPGSVGGRRSRRRSSRRPLLILAMPLPPTGC